MAIQNNSRFYHTAGIIAIALVLALGFGLRVYDLEIDPSTKIGKASQDLTTDPHHLTSFAANRAKLGRSEPFPFPKWRVFKVSLVSGMAYILFSFGEANRVCANLAGAIPSSIGIILFIWGLMIGDDEYRRKFTAVLIGAVFLAFNFLLITYNRGPFLESGLIFYFGLIFFLFQRYRFKTPNLLIMALLVSLACLTGKMFGLSIGAALALLILTSDEENRFRKTILFIVAGVVSAAMLALVLYGGDIPAYYSYLREQSVSAHGELYIFQGFKRVLSRFFSYGTMIRLFRDSPFLFASMYLTLTAVILFARRYYTNYRRNTTLRFSVYWLLTLLVLLMPFNYRPLRYAILLFFPLVLIIVSGIRLDPRKKNRMPTWPLVLSVMGHLYLNWFVMVHGIVDFFYIDSFKQVGWRAIIWMAVPAAILTAIMLRSAVARRLLTGLKYLMPIVGLLAVLSVGYQCLRYADWAGKARYTIRDASRDLAEVLGPDAVLTGPYAPTLTLDNDLGHFIYAFGLQKPDFNIFEQFPITHLAVDRTNFEVAVRDYPELKNAASATDFYLRDRAILILRIAGQCPTHKASGYRLTDYERTMGLIARNQLDTALYYNDRFLRQHPDNRSALLQKSLIQTQLGQYDQLLPLARRLRDMFVDDYSVQFFCACTLKQLALRLKRDDLMAEAEESRARALDLTDNKDFVHRKYDEIK